MALDLESINRLESFICNNAVPSRSLSILESTGNHLLKSGSIINESSRRIERFNSDIAKLERCKIILDFAETQNPFKNHRNIFEKVSEIVKPISIPSQISRVGQ